MRELLIVHQGRSLNSATLNIVGGSALLLFSISELSKIVQYLAGSKFRRWINVLAERRSSGVLLGGALAVLLSSSGAVTVMLVSLANARLLSLEQVFSVSLGAAIGSTLIVHLFAFKISEFGLLFVAIGAILEGISGSDKSARMSRGLLYLGLMFFSLALVADAGKQLQNDEFFQYIINYFRDRPFISLLIAAFLTSLIHSSAATIAFVMTLSASGVIDLIQSLPWVLGANLGTTTTAFFASFKTGALGKQAALGNFIIKLVGVALCFPLMEQLARVCTMIAGSVDRQVAYSHTLFNLGLAIVFFPFITLGVKLVRKLAPEQKSSSPFSYAYIDDRALNTPELALAQAQRELLRVSDIVEDMVKKSILLFGAKSKEKVQDLRSKDPIVDYLNKGIKLYLTRLSQGDMTEEQVNREFEMVLRANDLESIGDIIDKNIISLARKTQKKGYVFSKEGWKEILQFHEKVLECLQLSTSYFTSRDRVLQSKLVLLFEQIDEMNFELNERHIKRLHDGIKESLETSAVHMDILANLQRIASLSLNFLRSEDRNPSP